MPTNYLIKNLCQVIIIIPKIRYILNNIIKGSTLSNYLNTTLSADDVSLYFSNIGNKSR